MLIVEAAEHGGYLAEAWAVTTDPAHVTAELVFTLVFDGVLGGLVWRLGIRRWLDRRIAREHTALDAEHGVAPHESEEPFQFIERLDGGKVRINGALYQEVEGVGYIGVRE